MSIDTNLLSRIQFAFTISFHILFPAFSIGLATFLAVMEGLWLKTKDPNYFRICRFWTKIFALTFGMGIVSGIVMEFQLGTNWAGFTRQAGPVLGSLFTYEVLTAFFIEAGFLGVMLLGWERVGPRLHYFATLLVSIGVTLSAFWILSANSWMQTPTGAYLKDGLFHVDNWKQVVFNDSAMPRYFHMLLSAYLTTAFVIVGISAFYLLKKRHIKVSKTCFSFALLVITILTPIQIFVGDTVGVRVHAYQPLKTAAIEGIWDTQKGAPFLLFAWPNQQQAKNHLAIKLPHGAALINTHEWNGELIGLKSVPPEDRPFVPLVFFSFRIMLLVGVIMLAVGLYSLWLRARRKLYDNIWFLKLCVLLTPIGFPAIIAGWFTAETGRQPWVIYNFLRTEEAFSRVPVTHVITSLLLILFVYGLVFGVFYFRYLFKIIHAGPKELTDEKLPFAYMEFVERTLEKKK